MKPVLYRYRKSESVVQPFDGYRPPNAWTPLYDQAAMDAVVAAERERCAKVCMEMATLHAKEAGMLTHAKLDAFIECADAIRKGTE